MDEKYWIVNDCQHALRNAALPHMRKFELEVKLLKLMVELLKHEGGRGALGIVGRPEHRLRPGS